MARDEAGLEESDAAGNGANRRGRERAVGRRSYLRVVGTSVAAAGATTGLVSADEGRDADRSGVIRVAGRGDPSSFELTVDGTIETTVDDPTEQALVVSGTTVEGAVAADAVSFPFAGTLTDVTIIDGDVDVYLDDDPVDPAAFDA